ncbi:MAG: HD domain-containing protein [Solirubrobacterales bacterium]
MSLAPSRIDAKTERSALVRGALAVARQEHAGQFRQTGCEEIPFVEHVLAVGELLAEQNCADEVIAAGLLHDTLEHAEVGPDSLRDRFGAEVVGLVEALTEDASIADYEERKGEHRERVAAAGPDARAIFAADKCANVAVLRDAYEVLGESVDEDLPVSLDVKILVWEYDLEMLFRHSPGVPLVERFADEMVGLWGQRAEGERAPLC